MTTIAIAGNPNCGKSALFICLTGIRQTTGNWPGVTVERKQGSLKLDGHSPLVHPVKLENVIDCRTPPAIDRLIVIPDNEEVPVYTGQHIDHHHLHRVGVLEFIDQNITKLS